MLPSATPARTNWAGNYTYRAASLALPATVEELQHLIRTLPRLKALGARHSFNAIADTDGTQIALTQFNTTSLDPSGLTVTVGAGVTYGELAPWLDEHGFALPNLASLPHLSVVGACATATHGSGLANGCLSTSVRALSLLTGAGDLLHLSRTANPDIFPGAVVSVGALGVVTAITLDLVPVFQVAQTVYENLPFLQLEANLPAILGSAYSVSLFTDWQHGRATQLWLKHRLDPSAPAPLTPETLFGASRAAAKLHPLAGLSPENCTDQLGIPGPWYNRLPHFRHDYTPSAGAELQSEYFVPLTHGLPAIRAVETLRDRISPHLLISELRTVAADDLWLSPAFARDSLALHFTWKPELEAVLALLPAVEAVLEPFAARPHWAKLFTTPAAKLRHLYPRLRDFIALAARLDPDGRLRNSFLDEVLGA